MNLYKSRLKVALKSYNHQPLTAFLWFNNQLETLHYLFHLTLVPENWKPTNIIVIEAAQNIIFGDNIRYYQNWQSIGVFWYTRYNHN